MFAELGSLAIVFVGVFLATILSGMAGGGAGFVMTPLLLSVGLSPDLARAAACCGDGGTQVGSFVAGFVQKLRDGKQQTERLTFRESQKLKRAQAAHSRFMRALLGTGLITVSAAAWLIPLLDPSGVELFIGVFLIAMIPMLFKGKKKEKEAKRRGKTKKLKDPVVTLRRRRRVGFFLFACVSFAQALFGMGIGMFISMVVMLQFDTTTIEANHIKRQVMLFQSVVLFTLMCCTGTMDMMYSFATMAGALLGGYVGTAFGLKKGNAFVTKMLAGMMAVSGAWLLTPYVISLFETVRRQIPAVQDAFSS